MAKISDLPQDLVEEILFRVPITSLGTVRSTCKLWEVLSKNQILCKSKASQQFLGFMIKDFKVCSMRLNLHGLNHVHSSIKDISNEFDHVEISQVFHCDGLLLCVTRDNNSLVVWNPYLGQTRWLETRNNCSMFGIKYAIGYDNNGNHKILRFFYDQCYNFSVTTKHEIYDFKSNSWRVLDVSPNWRIDIHQHGVSLKGNTYFIARQKIVVMEEEEYFGNALLCFDFTRERFGKFLALPFQHYIDEVATLSSLRDEKLAALYQNMNTLEMEIWVTTKIDPNAVSWIPFLKVDMRSLTGFGFKFDVTAGSFFIDEEKKIAVVFDLDKSEKPCYDTAYIFGENGYFNKVNLGEARQIPIMNFITPWYCSPPLVCSSSYVPSLVQINQIGKSKRKRKRDFFSFLCRQLFIYFCYYFFAMSLKPSLGRYSYRFVPILFRFLFLLLDNFFS